MMLDEQLLPGDALLYSPTGLWGYLIALKTWLGKISHIEVYAGDGESWASRDGKGVQLYPLRIDHVATVLRPTQPLDLLAMDQWFETVKGQAYDWGGLMRFLYWGSVGSGNNNKQFCSEFAVRIFRAGGMDPFNGVDADAIAPATFLLSSCFTRVILKG